MVEGTSIAQVAKDPSERIPGSLGVLRNRFRGLGVQGRKGLGVQGFGSLRVLGSKGIQGLLV